MPAYERWLDTRTGAAPLEAWPGTVVTRWQQFFSHTMLQLFVFAGYTNLSDIIGVYVYSYMIIYGIVCGIARRRGL